MSKRFPFKHDPNWKPKPGSFEERASKSFDALLKNEEYMNTILGKEPEQEEDTSCKCCTRPSKEVICIDCQRGIANGELEI